MKNSIAIIILFLSLGVTAQQKFETTNFVILTSNIDQIEPILMAAQNESREGEFQIVFYGSKVKQLSNDSFKENLKLAEEFNVKLFVCQMSIERLKIDLATIPEEITLVENAFLYALQLQKKGYKTLNL
ncbi:DsrE family protein [Aequorivita viscosa]|uniref:Intracellular sulfur oxidation protein, DsrE/DsrF family n=1 Tax=Aequorivita viscosa TaxID=797419 RepID=A0A1M6NBV2_9FLAO|nr:DsrE family protein [Aequorivita viscosa]SDX45945.1 Intracellular sulfur oxidation protein, DsrE/DsrF family [Aequorivita viscosa]SHJ93016.1 Intracellular sulfur oxidation protein, DsrE/DsrF family [Aequorivita viscosa]